MKRFKEPLRDAILLSMIGAVLIAGGYLAGIVNNKFHKKTVRHIQMDMNNDQLEDIVTGIHENGCFERSSVYLSLQQKDGSFSAAKKIAHTKENNTFYVRDLDGDSRPDIYYDEKGKRYISYQDKYGSFSDFKPTEIADQPKL